MSESASDQEQRERQFDRIVQLDYYEAIERGESPTQEDLVNKHPDYVEAIQSFFADLRTINVAAAESFTNGETEAVHDRSAGMDQSTRPRSTKFIRDYKLLKKLGEGGMGSVYLAVHTRLEKRVAIKVLKGNRQSDQIAVQRFRKEIKAIGRLEHEHIVRALDAGKVDGLYFLVMEYIDGGDLSQVLNCCQSFSIPEACEIIRQAALGLDHAHHSGLIHRDIKPSNLMLTPLGRVKLLDLGLAQLNLPFPQSTALTVEGQAIGTLKYMAPEQIYDGKHVDATCDVYSLGVTLLELLSGKTSTVKSPVQVDCDHLREVRIGVPDELVDLTSAMTKRERSERIQTVAEVAEKLQTWTEGHDLSALYERFRQQSLQPILPPPPPSALAAQTKTLPSSQQQIGIRNRWRRVPLLIAACLLGFLLSAPLWFGSDDSAVDPTQAGATTSTALATVDVMIDPGVRVLDGKEFSGLMTDVGSGEQHRLMLGINEVPPGTYELELGDWETSTAVPIVLDPSSKRTVVVLPSKISGKFPHHFPELPTVAGSWARYSAQICPVGAGVEHSQSYEVTLRALQTQRDDDQDKELRWIQTEVKALPDFHEMAWLLIDVDLYRLEQELVIHKGYVQAKLPDDAANHVTLFEDQTLMVAWDDTVDPLEDLATEWGFQWPANRISTQALLAMLFGHSHPSVSKEISEMRAMLGASTHRSTTYSRFDDGKGVIESLRVEASDNVAGEASPAIGYTIERAVESEEIPFSFLHVEINGPKLNVSFDRSRGGLEGVVQQVDPERLRDSADRFAILEPPDELDYTIAKFPSEEGKYSLYKGKVERFENGRLGSLTVEVEITVGMQEPVQQRLCRWMEVRVESGPENGKLTEEVLAILVDEAAYQNNKEFLILRGWHQLRGETFDFHQGDAKPAEELLEWLGHAPSPPRFAAHAALTLLFDAKLPSSGAARDLRAMIAAADALALVERPKKPRRFERPRIGAVRGFEVEFDSPADSGLRYNITWSDEVPFGFCMVDLNLAGQFTVQTSLDDYGTAREDVPGTEIYEKRWKEQADETDRKLDALNVRAWNRSDGKYVVGKYDYYYENWVFLFTDTNEHTLSEVPFHELSIENRDWIMENDSRNWTTRDQNGNPNAQVRGILHAVSSKQTLQILTDASKLTIQDVPYTNLPEDEKDYVKGVINKRRSKSH